MSDSDNDNRRASPSTDNYGELRYVKALFYRGEYRSCIAVGEALLTQLTVLKGRSFHIHRAYIHFYLASAHDDLARQMYDQSKFKLARFETAERHYKEAHQALNAFQRADTGKEVIETPVKTRHILPREASSYSLLDIPPTPDSICSDDTKELLSWQQEYLEKPIGIMHDRINTMMSLTQQAKFRVSQLQAKRATARRAQNPQSSPTASTPSPMHSGRKLQASKSFWLFTPDVAKTNEKEQRIEEGRKCDWVRARFDPARYRLLAEHALAEL